MGKLFFTSDLHFGHDREFIWGPRGFKSVDEMNETLLYKWNDTVGLYDDVYMLGDFILGDPKNIEWVKRLNGYIHVVRGNHDMDQRMSLYVDCPNVVESSEGQYFKYNGQNFYLNHYPTFTSNLEKSDKLKEHVINLYGHTHQQTNFYQGIPFMYHVGVDSHNCYPVSVEQILKDIKAEVNKCKSYL